MSIITCCSSLSNSVNLGPTIVVLVIAFECLLFGFLIGGGLRSKIFNEEFLKKFEADHKEAFGSSSVPSKGGYPDSGNGRYS